MNRSIPAEFGGGVVVTERRGDLRTSDQRRRVACAMRQSKLRVQVQSLMIGGLLLGCDDEPGSREGTLWRVTRASSTQNKGEVPETDLVVDIKELS